MKHLLLSLIITIPLFHASAQSPEAPDTVKLIENASKVLISRNAETTHVEVETKKDYGKDLFSYSITIEDSIESNSNDSFDFEIPFGIGKEKRMKKSHSRIKTYLFFLGNGYFGQRFNYSDKGNLKNSIEIGFRDFIGLRWCRDPYSPSFSLGLGFGTEKYHAQDGFMYSRIGSNLVLLPVENGYSINSTALNVITLQLSLLFTLPIGSEIKFTAGGIGRFNTYARADTEIANGATKIKTTYKGLQQRLFTPELMCSLGVWDILGVYASWSPVTLFKAPYGPQIKSWSIGAIVNF